MYVRVKLAKPMEPRLFWAQVKSLEANSGPIGKTYSFLVVDKYGTDSVMKGKGKKMYEESTIVFVLQKQVVWIRQARMNLKYAMLEVI
ncbi:MAG: hypothetical protein IIA72_08665 [Proteobacteria bacterium]|nr:hypothetical protein [Pseudomonadota bacterium]